MAKLIETENDIEVDIYNDIKKIKKEIEDLKDRFPGANYNLYEIIAHKQIAISNLYIALSNLC